MEERQNEEDDLELGVRERGQQSLGESTGQTQLPHLVITGEPQTSPPTPGNTGGNHLIHGIQGIMSLSGNGSLADNVRNSISTLASHHDRSKSRPRDNKERALEVTDAVPHVNTEINIPPELIGPPDRIQKPLRLLNLPPELQIMILCHLEFADIERLRRTCKYLRALANPATIRSIMGDSLLKNQLLGHCHACLLRDPFRSRLLLGHEKDPGWPLNSKCIDCALRANDDRIRVGKRVMLASLVEVWVCRRCGLPVTEGAAAGNEQFHRPCYQAYNNILVYFFLLGWLQLALGIIACALAWRYWRFTVMVFAPTLVCFAVYYDWGVAVCADVVISI